MTGESRISKHPLQVPNLFRCWQQVARQLAASRVIALFLDFDGTLAPIQPRPGEVQLDDATRRVLTLLAHNPRFRVWIVTGRRRDDVWARVRVRGIRYLGLHGWEGRAGRPVSATALDALAAARETVGRAAANVPGLFIEDKGLTVAVHYRGLSEEETARARLLVQEAVNVSGAALRLMHGKKVWEVAPRELGDKGEAVVAELAALSRRALPVYIGDDRVDEGAFAALARGITVFVGGTARTRARFRLGSVAQVRRFLEKLAAEFA